jgi:hypothetical protein
MPTHNATERKPRSKQRRVTKKLAAEVLYGGKLRRVVVTLDLESCLLHVRPYRCQVERIYHVVDLWGPQKGRSGQDLHATSPLTDVSEVVVKGRSEVVPQLSLPLNDPRRADL